MVTVPSIRASILWTFTILFGLLTSSAQADLIILKDGTVIYGKARRESERYVDTNTNDLVTVPKGFFYVDNGPRRIYFSLKQMAEVTDHELPPGRMIVFPRKIFFARARRLRDLYGITDATEWDDKWNRVVRVDTENGATSLRQHLTILTPYWTKMDSYTKYKWNAFFLTSEMSPEKVRKLMDSHPKYSLEGDIKPEVRFRLELARFEFFFQAGWHQAAQAELENLLKKYDDKDKQSILKRKSKDLLKSMGKDYLRDLKLARDVGRHDWLQKQLMRPDARFKDPRLREELELMTLDYVKQNRKIMKIKKILNDLLKLIKNQQQRTVFVPFVSEVDENLGYENMKRLDTFLLLAESMVDPKDTQEQQAKKAGELLSMGVTGWLLGSASSEASFDQALKLWSARQFLESHAKVGAGADRLLRQYQARANVVSPDVMAQLIELGSCVEPAKVIPKGMVQEKLNDVNYWLQLPDEYHPRRRYPVLIVLHDSAGSAKEMLERWSDLAKKNGYILMAPQWQGGFGRGYGYTAAEHDKVMKPLMDLRKKFNIDDDRVFLFGMGQGGNMAYDVGLSHPDYFAGVIPMSANIHMVTRRYWPNAQYLPFYVVGGDHAGEPNVQARKQFERWVPHGYPAMFVQYKGRGREWFKGELPFIFSWMRYKKRYMPLTNLGRYGAGRLGDEFQTHRTGDNSFYWITSSNISSAYLNGNGGRWNASPLPARFYARIIPQNNLIVISQRGFKQMTIWLGRTGQVDFKKDVQVNVGLAVPFKGKVKPSLATLLEHYRDRLDRGRLFVAKISLGR